MGKQEDLERACDRADAIHRSGRTTPENWITWGEALLGIAECHQSLYSKRMFLQDAIHKLEIGLSWDNNSHHANWCLGNAHVASGLASPTYPLAQEHYRMASRYLDKAISLAPGNNKYADSLIILKQAEQGPRGIFESVEDPESVSIFWASLRVLAFACIVTGLEILGRNIEHSDMGG